MTIDNNGVIAEKPDDVSLCDLCANAAECRDTTMVVDACSAYWPRNESEANHA